MRNQNLKLKILNFELWFLIFSFQLLVIFALCGCAVVDFLTPEGLTSYEQLSAVYYRTELKQSSAADVLADIHMVEYDQVPMLISQSKSIIAAVGQSKKGYKTWFNMVAFDEGTPKRDEDHAGSTEYELKAKRKYFFVTDEKPKILFVEPRENLSFDCQMVLEGEVLDKPYANENAKRIATLRRASENVHKDMGEVSKDNKSLAVSGMLINQALETILVKLDSSPVLASELADESGIEFNHISFDKGRIRMVVAGDVVTVKMKLGSLVSKFEEEQ
jgi:hypothetical protein